MNRIKEIDFLKAVSILAVVGIHSISTTFESKDLIGKILGEALRFAVPGLLFAAGFLFNKNKEVHSRQIALKFIKRIIPPYLFCAFMIMFFNLPGKVQVLTVPSFLFNLFFGNVLGIYYYIFVILYLYCLSLLLRKLSDTIFVICWLVCFGTTILFYTNLKLFFPSSQNQFFFYLMRHPLIHLLPYLTGWLFSLYYKKIIFIKNYYQFVLLMILCLLCNQFVVAWVWSQLLTQVQIYFTILFLCLLGRNWQNNQIIFLSQSSYGIFLLHFPIVRAVQGLVPHITLDFSLGYALAAFMTGLGGSIMIIKLCQRIIGKYSIYLIGA